MGKTFRGDAKKKAQKAKLKKRKQEKRSLYGIVVAVLLPFVMLGCGKAVTIAFTDSTGVQVGSITLQETTFPVVSYSSGPRFFASVSKDADAGFSVRGYATITNDTNIIGLYQSHEMKRLELDASAHAKTNETKEAVASRLGV